MARITRRKLLKVGAAGVASLAGLHRLPQWAWAQTPEVTLGAVYPLTGSLARIGASIKNAVDLAGDLINTPRSDLDLPLSGTGGPPKLREAKLRLTWADSQADPAKGSASAER